MSKRFVAFYWTRPVFWAGFNRGFDDVADAYERSATIRYQIARIAQFNALENGRIFDEFALMENSPHTATREFAAEFEKNVVSSARSHKAKILFVNFKEVDGWRSHQFLDPILANEELCIPVSPETIRIGRKHFNPARHFAMWRARSQSEGGRRREFACRELILAYKLYGSRSGKWDLIKDHMNDRKLRSFSGRIWSSANAEKVFNRYIRHALDLPVDQLFNPNGVLKS